jgi:hypothetical protein
MLNIVTVHWQSPKWIEPQLSYLERNVETPFRVFASLNGIDDAELWKRFHFAAELDGTHAEKLNTLAQIVLEQSDSTDQLLFLDGDAFPIRPIGTWMDDVLRSHPLAAVRRDENLGDCQPHPCFCFTTTTFWNEIQGDWREGGTWTSSVGKTTTDVGGTLLHQLADREIGWLPLLRTNTHNADPLWFGVYEHRVYHHGAGFRPRISRVSHYAETEDANGDGNGNRMTVRGSSLEGLAVKAARQPSLLIHLRPRHIAKLPPALTITVAKQRQSRNERRQRREAERADRDQNAVYSLLVSDPQFYRRFDNTSR